MVKIVDGLVAFALVSCAMLWADQGHLPKGDLADFLGTRITLLNACLCGLLILFWMKCLGWLGLYRRASSDMSRPIIPTLLGTGLITAVLALYLRNLHPGESIRAIALSFFSAAIVYEAGRVLFCKLYARLESGEPERVIIFGTGRRASKAWRELRTRHHRSKVLLGFFDDRSTASMPPDIAGQFLGGPKDLSEYLLHNIVDEMIIATPMRSCYDMTQQAISISEAAGVRVVCLNDMFRLSHGMKRASSVFFGLNPQDERHEVAQMLKRVFDATCASIGLILLAPLFLVIGVAVKLTSPGPVFFTQLRYGHGRRQFRMYKFRSMVRDAPALMMELEKHNEAQGPIFKMRNDPRVTPLGQFLRSTSLDELPQLWNVLIGDMSLVGPRPMSLRDVSLFNEAQLLRRFSVRPGITGRWQVAGRSSLNFDQWIALDFSYIDEWTLGLDLQILAQTVPAVLRRHGAV